MASPPAVPAADDSKMLPEERSARPVRGGGSLVTRKCAQPPLFGLQISRTHHIVDAAAGLVRKLDCSIAMAVQKCLGLARVLASENPLVKKLSSLAQDLSTVRQEKMVRQRVLAMAKASSKKPEPVSATKSDPAHNPHLLLSLVSEEEVKDLINDYPLPEGCLYILSNPDERAPFMHGTKLAMHTQAIYRGLRLPFSKVFMDFFTRYDIHPGQLVPNAILTFRAIEVLFTALRVPFDHYIFRFMFHVKVDTRGCITFARNNNYPFKFEGMDSNIAGWKNCYVKVVRQDGEKFNNFLYGETDNKIPGSYRPLEKNDTYYYGTFCTRLKYALKESSADVKDPWLLVQPAALGIPILGSDESASSQSPSMQMQFGNCKKLNSLSSHSFAAILPGDSVAGVVVTNGVLNFLNIYNNILIVRLVLTWFPNAPPAIVAPLSTLCDPYLNIFRGLIPPLGGTLDLSPILAFLVLNVFTSAAAALPAELPPAQTSQHSSPKPEIFDLTFSQRKWIRRLHGNTSKNSNNSK